VSFPKNDPYFQAWLKRTGRQLAASGRLTQVATALASDHGESVATWRSRLRTILNGEEIPSPDLLTHIDALLAAPSKSKRSDDSQSLLF
jgi:hypothetical protein